MLLPRFPLRKKDVPPLRSPRKEPLSCVCRREGPAASTKACSCGKSGAGERSSGGSSVGRDPGEVKHRVPASVSVAAFTVPVR